MIITHNPNKITHPYFNDPTNRWLNGLTNEQHHKLPALSSTSIKFFHKKSPWAFYQKYIMRQTVDYEIRPEFVIGTLIHLAILEPEVFETTVFVNDDARNTNKYKEFRQNLLNNIHSASEFNATLNPPPKLRTYEESEIVAEQIKEIKKEKSAPRKKKIKTSEEQEKELEPFLDPIGKEPIEIEVQQTNSDYPITPSKNGAYMCDNKEVFIIKSSEMTMLRRIQENIKNHVRLSLMLPNSTHIEQSGIAQCPKTGLFLSCRGDARSDLGFFIDPKSIMELTRHTMESSMSNFAYYLQHVHYLYVANLIEPGKYENFYFLFVSKESPYEVCFAHLDEEAIDKSSKLYFDILNRIAECEYKQKWPTLDNSNGLLLSLPRWTFS